MSGNFKGRICVVPSHQLKFFVYSAKRSTNSKHRDHTVRLAVAYKKLKTLENNRAVNTKSGRGRL